MARYILPSNPENHRKKRNHWKEIKNSILMKNTPVEAGIVAIASPVPLFFCTVPWCWILVFVIGMTIFDFNVIPNWLLTFSLLPLFISPALGVIGIIHGIVKLKGKHAWIGILLSVLGLAENFLLIYCMGYLGSRF